MRSRGLDVGRVLFCVFMDRDEVEVNKNAKKNEANIRPSSPNKLSLVNKGFIMWPKKDSFLRHRREKSRVHLARSGSQSGCRICFILATCGFSHMIIVFF